MSISRFIRYRDASGSTAWGLVDGTTVRQLTAAPYLDHRPTGHTALLADVTLLAPAEPPKIFAIGTTTKAISAPGHNPRNRRFSTSPSRACKTPVDPS